MFVKLAVLACVAVCAFGQHWGGGGHDGGWNGNQNALDSGSYTGDGDYHGEGLQEAGAFSDVSQNWGQNNGGQWNGGQDNGGQWNGGHDNGGQWNGGQDSGAWNGGNNGGWNGGNNGGGWNGGNNGGWNGGNNGGGWNGGNAGGWNGGHNGGAALLPAGVDAHACPNYPYCH